MSDSCQPLSPVVRHSFFLNLLWGPFRGKFDYIVLLCPTFINNTTYDRFVDRDPHIFVIACPQHEIETELRVASSFFAGTNTLFILDDCAASKDVKGRQASWSISGLVPSTTASPCGS